MRIVMRQEDPGGIDPALDRKSEFTVTGNKGLAGTAVIMLDLLQRKAPDARGGAGRAGTLQEDNLALVALPLPPADTFKGYLRTPYGLEHGRIQGYRDEVPPGMEEYAGGIRHTLPREGWDLGIWSAGRA
jgi:hypothetical protein